jgi:hypothetical protein
MTSMEQWERDGREFGWVMPSAPAWKRLLGIRHIRAVAASIAVGRHNAMWRSMGAIPTGYDEWCVYGIAQGKELPNG